MIELLPVSIGIGLCVNIFLSEALGIGGAGLVVPGYLALRLTDPLSVAVTLACGFVAFGAVKAIGSTVIIFGRRRTVMMILAGYLTGMGARLIAGDALGSEALEYQVIGFIIPGLIATWLDRRGVVESFCSLIIASAIVRLILVLIFGTGIET